MYSLAIFEEGIKLSAFAGNIWIVLAVFFVLAGVGALAKNFGWLKKEETAKSHQGKKVVKSGH